MEDDVSNVGNSPASSDTSRGTLTAATPSIWKTAADDGSALPCKVLQDDAVSVVRCPGVVSDTSRGARRRKGIAQRRTDVSVDQVIGNNEDHPRPASPRPDRRGFVECRHCRIGFRDRVTYTLHMGYHGFDAPFSCNMCGHQSADRVAFFLHIATAAH